MTTVAAMLAVRAQDDSTGVIDAGRQLDLASGRGRGGGPRRAWPGRSSATGQPHIGVLLPNGPEYLFWLNGAALAGAAIVGINPTRRGEALAADIRATDCALIVTDADGAALLEGLDLGLDARHVLVVGLGPLRRPRRRVPGQSGPRTHCWPAPTRWRRTRCSS